MNRTIAIVCACATMALAMPGAAMAGPLEDGQAAYNRGAYDVALRILRPLADHGDASAQYILGLSYSLGHGVRQDHAQAARWYRAAAKQGVAAAQANLGAMYADGKSVPQDYAQAIALWREATN